VIVRSGRGAGQELGSARPGRRAARWLARGLEPGRDRARRFWHATAWSPRTAGTGTGEGGPEAPPSASFPRSMWRSPPPVVGSVTSIFGGAARNWAHGVDGAGVTGVIRSTDGSLVLAPPSPAAPSSVTLRDAWVPGPGGDVHGLVARPAGEGPFPTVFEVHGETAVASDLPYRALADEATAVTPASEHTPDRIGATALDRLRTYSRPQSERTPASCSRARRMRTAGRRV